MPSQMRFRQASLSYLLLMATPTTPPLRDVSTDPDHVHSRATFRPKANLVARLRGDLSLLARVVTNHMRK